MFSFSSSFLASLGSAVASTPTDVIRVSVLKKLYVQAFFQTFFFVFTYLMIHALVKIRIIQLKYVAHAYL